MKPATPAASPAPRHLGHRKFVWTMLALAACLLVLTLVAAQTSDSHSPPTPPAPPAAKPLPPKAPGVRPDFKPAPLGLRLADISAEELKALDIPHGLRVEHAIGTAGSAGLKAGDIITKFNGHPVQDVARFWQQAEAAGWDFMVTVKRGEMHLSIGITPP